MSATAAVKAGASCKKAGQTSTYAGKKFTCIKSGKKLVWNKGVVVVKPTPVATPTPTAEPTPTPTPTPTAEPTPTPTKYVDPTKPISGQPCLRNSTDVVGYNDTKILVVLMCNQWDDRYLPRPGGDEVDQVTGKVIFKRGKDTPIRRYGISYMKPPQIEKKPISTLSDSNLFTNWEACKIADGDPQLTNMGVGFPVPTGRTKFAGKIKIQVLTVDFPDVQANSNPQDDYKAVTAGMKQFWESQAGNGATMDISIPNTYLRLPNPIMNYKLGNSLARFEGENYWAFMREAIRLYDPQIDFSGVSTVVVAVPLSVTASQIGTWVVNTQVIFNTAEGNVYNTMYTGNGQQLDLPSWVHEYGHTLGLTDMRNTVDVTQQSAEGLGIYDIMGVGNVAPEILAWSRFISGMFLPSQFHCKTSAEVTTHWLIPIEQQGEGVKGVAIKTGEFTSLVIESRRAYGYDSNIGTDAEGVLVYTVDSRVPYRRSPVFIVPPARSKDRAWETDSALKLGESVVSSGWKVTVTETGDFGDVVKVEKIG
jgi:M6 family metalloprotease-like protein